MSHSARKDLKNNKKADEKTIRKFKNALRFVKEHVATQNKVGPPVISLAEDYWLEKLDPQHRSNRYLETYFKLWAKDEKSNDNFFAWLDKKEEQEKLSKVPELQKKDKKELKSAEKKETLLRGNVIYKLEELEKYKVKYKDGKVCDLNEKPINTLTYTGKSPQFALFVISPEKEMMLAEHESGRFHHSSLVGGGKTICSGMIKIQEGKIVEINNFSGHYHHRDVAKLRYFYEALKLLPDDVFAPDCKIHYKGNIYLQDGKLDKIEKVYTGKQEFLKFAKDELQKTNSLFFMADKKENVVSADVVQILLYVKQAYQLLNADPQNSEIKMKDLPAIDMKTLKENMNVTIMKLKSVSNPSIQLKQVIKTSEEIMEKMKEVKLKLNK